jgi:hypothetical protein
LDPWLLRIWVGAFASVLCLAPLAAYLLFLAYLNGRRRATLLSGPWDFGALLLGLAGFVTVGGTLLLTSLTSAGRAFWQRGDPERLRADWQEQGNFWLVVWMTFVALLAAGVVALLRYRRRWTVIYNVTPEALEESLNRALDAAGVKAHRRGDVWAFARPGGAAAHVHLDALAALRNATLFWEDDDPGLRREVEAELARGLRRLAVEPNAAAGWFLTAATAALSVAVLILGVLVWWMLGA